MGAQWLMDWALFAGVMALGQFSPGPDMILLTRISLKDGCRAGWLVGLGIVTGLCLHAALAIGGMSTLMARGGFFEKGLSVLSACYLAWLGWKMVDGFVASFREQSLQPSDEEGEGNWYLKGLLCNLLNPKVVIFFAGITTLFLKEERAGWWPVLLWVTIVGEGLFLWGCWVVLLQNQKIRQFYAKKGRWLDLGFGIGLWILAGMLFCY